MNKEKIDKAEEAIVSFVRNLFIVVRETADRVAEEIEKGKEDKK